MVHGHRLESLAVHKCSWLSELTRLRLYGTFILVLTSFSAEYLFTI
jgi:hypothetical protein